MNILNIHEGFFIPFPHEFEEECNMEKNYVKIDSLEYVKKGIESGQLKPVVAVKASPVAMRRGEVGETVVTYSQAEGKSIVEKVDTVKIDPSTGLPQMVLTKLDKDGNVVVDEFGHENSWIYQNTQEQFEIDYPTQLREGVYVPSAKPRIMVPIVMDVIITQWGSDEKIAAGGWINITDLNDIYGISQTDFDDTHVIVGEATNFTLTLK